MFAEVQWNGLTENNSYAWYSVVTDDFTGKTVSKIWTFTKGKAYEQSHETVIDITMRKHPRTRTGETQ